MLTRVIDDQSISRAVARRQAIADGPAELRHEWLAESQRVAIPEETGRHLEDEECARLEAAFSRVGVTRLTAIANDPLIVDELVFQLTSGSHDLQAFASKFSGINVLLVADPGVDYAILFSTDDFRLVAGPREFVVDFVGDVHHAKRAFLEFANNHIDDIQDVLAGVLHHFDWIDGELLPPALEAPPKHNNENRSTMPNE